MTYMFTLGDSEQYIDKREGLVALTLGIILKMFADYENAR